MEIRLIFDEIFVKILARFLEKKWAFARFLWAEKKLKSVEKIFGQKKWAFARFLEKKWAEKIRRKRSF